MIDFRYHLVSLASVLIALAVGIVLGAGPLKEDIGNTLTTEVTKLREEKASLRTELDDSQSALSVRDDFEREILPHIVRDRLAGRTVAVVALPGADSKLVSTTTDTLTAAGATVIGQVALTDDWVSADADLTATRDELASRLLRSLRADPPEIAGSQALDAVLASVLVNPGGAAEVETTRTNDQRVAAWGALTDGGFVDGSISKDKTANTAVIVGQAVTADSADDATRQAAGLAALARVMDARGMGAVLASNQGISPVDGASVVSAARESQGDAAQLSTVDDIGSAMGQASVVLALLEQYDNAAGQYGLMSDATAPYPQSPPA